MTPPDPTAPLALVTGASSGLGLETARLLAGRGWDVVLSARSRATLDAVRDDIERDHGVRGYVQAHDLARPDGVAALLSAVEELGRPLDLLVANAGVGLHGPYLDTNAQAERALLHLNIEATVALTRGVLPGMVARSRGRILFVGSTGAFAPGPLMATYYASKAFVLSYSDALAEELDGSGVSVTCLCPGPTRTPFLDRAGARSGGSAANRGMDVRVVAEAGIQAALAGRRGVVPGWGNKLSVLATRLLPRTMLAKIVGRFQETRR